MTVDLLKNPRSQVADLGLPMPDDPHAVSACLPLWDHNIGYEEGDPAVIDRLQAAYPRFCFHPVVVQWCETHLDSPGKRGLPFASLAAAKRAADYVASKTATACDIVSINDGPSTGLVVDEAHFATLKQYWQHAGENVSSRVAEALLAGESPTATETQTRSSVRSRVAEFQGTSADGVFLFPSGMAAIAAAWRAIKTFRGASSCQFGFPYVDTLKIQQRFPDASHKFYPRGNGEEFDELEKACSVSPPDVIFCEVPTNPLLVTPDLCQLRRLADEHDILLVVDDTLAACGNLDTLHLADITVTSLTKYFSGAGNVLAGSLTINPRSRHAAELGKLVAAEFEETLSDLDVQVLEKNSRDFRERIEVINSNAEQLADFLRGHALVEDVFYPSAADKSYEALRTADGGYGGLLSFVLKEAASTTPAAFDALNVCKGPNLGTNFTLCCPYTILAHYTELDFAESSGVSRWLLRVSVGLEPIEELRERFTDAFAAAPAV